MGNTIDNYCTVIQGVSKSILGKLGEIFPQRNKVECSHQCRVF